MADTIRTRNEDGYLVIVPDCKPTAVSWQNGQANIAIMHRAMQPQKQRI